MKKKEVVVGNGVKGKRVLLNDKEAADYLGHGVQTLRNWRWYDKYGPTYIKFPNGRIKYDLQDLDDFIDAARHARNE